MSILLTSALQTVIEMHGLLGGKKRLLSITSYMPKYTHQGLSLLLT